MVMMTNKEKIVYVVVFMQEERIQLWSNYSTILK